MQVSIIIVNYNTKDLLKDCLNSIYEQTKDLEFEVIVSDNGSTDGSIKMIKLEFPQVLLIENNANLGFGSANNRGTKIAKGKYILFLNSDTVLLNNAVKEFYTYWEDSDNKDNIGALGCNLLGENYEIVHSHGSLKGFPTLKGQINAYFRDLLHISRLFILPHLRNKKLFKSKKTTMSKIEFYVGKVSFITGADLFVLNNKDAFFDEDFLLYCEDVELQKRLYDKKLDRLLISGPKIMHLEHKSMNNQNNKNYFLSVAKTNSAFSILLYFKKHPQKQIYYWILKKIIHLIWLNPLIIKETKNLRTRLKQF